MIKSLKPIVVVEPHADDAFLSLGAHIERWVKEGRSVTIVTVCSATRKRAADAAAYANALGAKWLGLKYEDLQTIDFSSSAVPRNNVICIAPLGIQNPDHINIAKRMKLPRVLFYLDHPYGITQRNSEEVTAAASDMRLVSYLKPPIRKWRHIPLFKDQAKFFHYNTVEKLNQGVEMIFSPGAFSGF